MLETPACPQCLTKMRFSYLDWLGGPGHTDERRFFRCEDCGAERVLPDEGQRAIGS
jgi:hypothetical protein